ncbi:hypothetical protein ACFW9X_24315, partial [Streptomyces sp. NPDC059466]
AAPGPRPGGAPARPGAAVAGHTPAPRPTAAHLVSAFGFDPVAIGPLAEGVRLQPGTEPFGANVSADELRAMIDRFPASQRGETAGGAHAAATPPAADVA